MGSVLSYDVDPLRLALSQLRELFLEAHRTENSSLLYKGLLPNGKGGRSSEAHVWREVELLPIFLLRLGCFLKTDRHRAVGTHLMSGHQGGAGEI